MRETKKMIGFVALRSTMNIPKHVWKSTFFARFFILIVLTVSMYTYYSSVMLEEDKILESYSFSKYNNTGYLIKTPGCRIPEMYLNGPEIDKYMNRKYVLNCRSKWNYTLPLVSSNSTALILNISALATLNITKEDSTFKCHYTPIERFELKYCHTQTDECNDDVVKLGEEKYFEDSVIVLDEMVEVMCKLQEDIVYRNYHIFIYPTESTKNKKDGNVSVVILGIDSVSRLNFYRQMPKTSAFLSKLGNIEMLGYNKLEDNTFLNVIPLLTGLSVEELQNSGCWSTGNDYFDDCHFLWDDFKSANFDTVLVEDSPWMGTFNLLRRGFFKKPTDHYLRPLMIMAEAKLGHEIYAWTNCCIGAQLGMTALLDHSLKVAKGLSDHSYMGFFWSASLTHDIIDFPNFGDDDLKDFFVKFNESGQLNSTIVVFMSDHGMRWGDFRTTYQGGLEDRLPMLRFIIPEWFKKKYARAIKNLNENAFRLTTPYDLHETLLEFIDTNKLDDDIIDYRTGTNHHRKRSSSLFLNIPENRTCQTAGIPKHYCACHDSKTKISVNNIVVVKVADFLMFYINSKLSDYPQCANLTLHEITTATVEVGRESRLVKDYELHITTVPGFGQFEATLRANNGEFQMVGTISRLNEYGNQSICVNNAKMKLLCYCNQKV